MSSYDDIRRQFEMMWESLAHMPWAVPLLSEFLVDGDLAAVPNLDRFARGILLPHRFETPMARLGLINEFWDEHERDMPDTVVRVVTDDAEELDQQRRLLWVSEGLLFDDVAARFGEALPPAVRAHMDQMITGYQREFSWKASQS